MKQSLLLSLFDELERRPLSVSELTAQVRGLVEQRFTSVWVEGEISNFKAHASGHWYFTIKDHTSQLRATCFRAVNARIRFRPSSGLQVRARGRLTVYEPRGEYELVVEALDPVGAGALRVAFEQMRDGLAAEGLFDEASKRPLPLFPRRIGVVTSPSGAAIQDILQVIARRTRTVHILIAPARVQGENASREIAGAINLLNEHHTNALGDRRWADTVDVIIVGRGGGSSEDLWAFNEEIVARAIRASQIPVISAVGHETDFTIADFAADLRAPTPSAAAEVVAAQEDEMRAQVEDLTRELLRSAHFRIISERERVRQAATSYGFADVQANLRGWQQRTNEATRKLETLMTRGVEQARHQSSGLERRLSPARLAARTAAQQARLSVLCAARDAAVRLYFDDRQSSLSITGASLDALSPLAVLQRGYALAQTMKGDLLRSARTVSMGDRVRVRLAEGVVECVVETVETK